MQLFSLEPASHHVVVRELESRYEALLASGQVQPFVYPLTSVGAFIGIVYLCIDHRNRPMLRLCRFLVWGAIATFSTWCVLNTRARNPAAAFGVGLVSAWATLWCAVLLVFNDAQADFCRIERKETDGGSRVSAGQTKHSNGLVRESKDDTEGNGELRRRTLGPPDGIGSTQGPLERKGPYAWQHYPASPFIKRLDWVCDIFSSFRGMSWNLRISGLPPPPNTIQDQIATTPKEEAPDRDTSISHVGVRRYDSKRELLRHNMHLLCRNYLILDLIKTLIVNDPYFWTGSYSRRPAYLPPSLDAYPVLDQSCRLLISLAAVYYALESIFALGPVFFVGVLGATRLGVRGESWIYCDQFGAFSNVLDKGLAGWWGGWWHQTFRVGFDAPASRLIALLAWEKRSVGAKLLRLCVAFVLSGFLHACGSFTQLGDTRPLRGPFLFFVLQIFGVGFQVGAAALLARVGVRDRAPRWVRRGVNLVYVGVWMYHTAPLLVDDFAKGGIWLFEPLPVSIFRGLGFGAEDDGWFPLAAGTTGGDIARWHTGDRWWKSGIAL